MLAGGRCAATVARPRIPHLIAVGAVQPVEASENGLVQMIYRIERVVIHPADVLGH